MKILLSPAKSIDTSRVTETYTASVPDFIKESKKLVSKLKKMNVAKLGELMNISKDLAELNASRYKNWKLPIEQDNEIIPAVLAFNGEVYKGLDAYSFSKDELERAQQNIRILSGLYGMLKPMDLIYPYRLEMGTNWKISQEVNNLYQFWGNKIALKLNKETAKNEVIINLASNEYFKVINRKTLKPKVITPLFKEFKNGEFKTIMIYAKHARGAMASYIVRNDIQDHEELKLYNVDSYTFNSNQSSENEWVFVR